MGDLLKDPRMKMDMRFPLRTLFNMASEGVVPPGTAEAVEADLNRLIAQAPEKLAESTVSPKREPGSSSQAGRGTVSTGRLGGLLAKIFRLGRRMRPIEGVGGYVGKILMVDLTSETITAESLPDEAILGKYLGGTGLGIKMTYDEVPAGLGRDCKGGPPDPSRPHDCHHRQQLPGAWRSRPRKGGAH